MTNQIIPFVFLLFLGSLCIQKTLGRSIQNPVYGPPWYSNQVTSNPVLLNAGLGLGTDANTILNAGEGYGYTGVDLFVAPFSDIIFRQLMEDSAFCGLFSNKISVDNAINIGILIGQALGNEGLVDSYWATNLLTNALTSTNPNSGPEAFGRALADAAGQIILRNNILNSANYNSLANTFAGIIVNSASSLYSSAYGTGIGLGVDIGSGFNLNGKNHIGVATNVNADAGANFGGLLNNNLDLNINRFDNLDLNINRFAGDRSVGTDFGLGTENAGLGVGANIGTDLDINAGLGIGANLGNGLGIGAGLSPSLDVSSGLGMRLGLGAGLDAGLSIGAGAGLGSNIGADASFGLDAGLGVFSSLGTTIGGGISLGAGGGISLGAGGGIGLGAGEGIGLGTGLGVGANAGIDLGAGTAIGLNTGLGAGIGLDAGLGIGAGAGIRLGAGLSVGAGADVVTRPSLNTGAGFGLESNLNIGASVGLGIKAGIGVDVGAGLDISLDKISLFKTELIKELLKDRYFRSIFSDYLPEPVLKSVVSVIAQYLAIAFSVPRSSFLPLEKIVIELTSKKPTIDGYANIISSTIEAVLQNKNIITPPATVLQVSIASRAISSGIVNFLKISTISGVGVGLSTNSYNSFFSILNGLGKLPYVGIDAASRKLPPIIKTAKALSSAIQFAKVLFYNLVSSNEFYQSFSLCLPPSVYKKISKTLGDFMSEAFGSPNPSFFADIYAKALLISINKLNHKTYARIISIATTRALYLLGYFLSGNVNIQAAIATNAIVRALVLGKQKRSLNSQTNELSEILSLPWATQITGVSSLNSLLNIKGIGIGANVGVGADVAAGAGVGVRAGVAVDSNVEVGANIGAGAGVGVGAAVRVGSGLGVEAGVNNGKSVLVEREFEFDDLDLEFAAAIEDNVDLIAALEASLKEDDRRKLLRSKRDIATEVTHFATGLDFTDSGIKKISNGQVSILEIFPRLLANKLYRSTALYTTIYIVGIQKVANLIAQSMADQFGFTVATKFLESVEKDSANTNKNFEVSVLAIANATTNALAEVGILDIPFSFSLAFDLAIAVTYCYSSLLATSLQ